MKAFVRSALRWGAIKTMPPVVAQVYDRNLTYLRARKMRNIVWALKEIDRKGLEGDIYEFGMALGGSAIVMASLMDRRCFHGFDLFGMIPPPSDRDSADTHARYEVIVAGKSAGINGDPYYGYEDSLYDKVVENFAGFELPVDARRITLHRGLFEDTLDLGPDARIALAHVDCDWFDPVRFCLERIAPHMVPGGLIIVDDYNDYEGCQRATDTFLEQNKDRFRMRLTAPHAILECLG